jgi:hypothetical protein
MKVTNTRLIVLLLTFFAGVLLVYSHDGAVFSILDGYAVWPASDSDRCWH